MRRILTGRVAWACVALAVVGASLYVYWRYFFFFRDPDRIAPRGDNIVSPADGTIVYIKRFQDGKIPPSTKEGKEIIIDELTKTGRPRIANGYLVGIFMSPFDVHVNRAPIDGTVEEIQHFQNDNVLLARMWLRITLESLHIVPRADHFAQYPHILQNERNTTLINGRFPVYVVQIADQSVNKVVVWTERGTPVAKGQRFGMIKMGSQVDIVFPDLDALQVKVSLGQHVYAGETVLAEYKS